jgi:hypothetical protein
MSFAVSTLESEGKVCCLRFFPDNFCIRLGLVEFFNLIERWIIQEYLNFWRDSLPEPN